MRSEIFVSEGKGSNCLTNPLDGVNERSLPSRQTLDWEIVRVAQVVLIFCVAGATVTACGSAKDPRPATAAAPVPAGVQVVRAPTPIPTPTLFEQTGMASWYGPGFAGKLTANGERFDPDDMTCAHRKLPFHTKIRVTNLENGLSVVVRVNDRGPYAKQRIVDLSKEAAKRLGFVESGVAQVRVEVVEIGKPKPYGTK